MNEPTAEKPITQSREEIALGKLVYPYSEPYPFYHVTKVDKLKSILRAGLVSEDFAHRTGIDEYEKNFNSSWNEGNISLYRNPLMNVWDISMGDVAIIVRPLVPPIKAEGVAKRWDTHEPYDDEYLVRHRIAPREIIGIAYGSLHPDKTKEAEAAVLQITEELPPSQAIPIYEAIHGLIWPERLNQDQLRERLGIAETKEAVS